ncbi:reverse transcriptase domain-containing protein [Cronobacter dublinensis]|uniref:reverse transcriptase domain-containing protein n=1 Tax=Cronobacter dublinensis TaxID=413497 RepID=UPI00300DCA4E
MDMWKSKFEIKKDRWVFIPSDEMSRYGKGLHKLLLSRWRVPLYYYHMRDGGHVAAARVHLKNDYFSLIDISNFFESTSQSRVTRELKTLLPYEEARRIAKISTVRVPKKQEKKFAVPYGYPQSPILATLCLRNSHAGHILDRIYKSGVVSVSVYMDDIIVSGKDLNVVYEKFKELCKALEKSRYHLNNVKTQPPSKNIVAFNLEISHKAIKVTSKRLVQFLQVFTQSKNKHEREGIAMYVHSVNPEQAKCHFPKKSTS